MTRAVTPVVALSEAIRIVASDLDATEAVLRRYGGDPSSWHDRHRAAMDALAGRLAAKAGARIARRWDGARVSLCGVSSSSTNGIAGALRNWLAAARKREAAR